MSFYSGFILISSKFYLDRIRIKSRQNVVRVVLSILYRFLFDKTYFIFSKTVKPVDVNPDIASKKEFEKVKL